MSRPAANYGALTRFNHVTTAGVRDGANDVTSSMDGDFTVMAGGLAMSHSYWLGNWMACGDIVSTRCP